MIKNEYLKVKEISQIKKMTTRNVRKIISKLVDEKNEYLIHKNNNGEWLIHHLLLSNFDYSRNASKKYYALSIDPVNDYTEEDIHKIMQIVYDKMDDNNIEIHYVIEKKKKGNSKNNNEEWNGRNHLHCYINCNQRTKLIRLLRLGFSELSYKENEIFDLDGWRNYITKDGNKIKTIKK